jgi:flagellar basal-body rod protein FlgB
MFDQIHHMTDLMHASLQSQVDRQRLISNNLANGDTPGFKASDLQFEAHLQHKLAQMQGLAPTTQAGYYTHAEHLPLDLPEDNLYAVQLQDSIGRNDGNNVDLDLEMTKMAQANLSYATVSQLLSGRFSGVKYVISEGGR